MIIDATEARRLADIVAPNVDDLLGEVCRAIRRVAITKGDDGGGREMELRLPPTKNCHLKTLASRLRELGFSVTTNTLFVHDPDGGGSYSATKTTIAW